MSGARLDLVALEQQRHREQADAALLGEVLRSPDLHCHYQPVVALDDGTPVAHEALLRLGGPHSAPHGGPRGGFAPAAVFEAAARHGQTGRLDRRARELAVRDAGRIGDGDLFVNCEPGALTGEDEEVAGFLAALHDAGLAPERVVLELTEHRHPASPTSLADALVPYRRAGVRVAVDDVGAGWSSLGLVALLEPEVLKVDGRVGQALAHRRAAAAVLRAVVGLAEDLGAVVVVEGLEDADGVAAALASGATLGQGWAVGLPRRARAQCCPPSPVTAAAGRLRTAP